MKRVLRTLAALCLLSGAISAQVVTVRSQIGLGNGNPASGKNYLHFESYNCGGNFPIGVDASGNAQTVVSRTFDIVANSQGIAQGTVMPNDKILCGGIPSTQWKVSVLSAQGTPIAGPKRYFICSSTASGFCSQIAGAGAPFDVSLAQIAVADPPAPGYVQIFGNPFVNQYWNQPTGTTAFFTGTFDFSGANLIGISGGGGGGGISSVTGSSPISVTAGSAPVVSIAKADSTHNGYLASTDWNAFNSKGIGSVTSVGITVPQGLAVSGCPITGAGTCAITLNGQFPVASLGTGSPASTNFLSGSGAWAPAVTFGGVPFLSLAPGTNISGSVTSGALTLNSTSAVTYPIAAPEGSATVPQYSFSLHPELGLAAVLGTGSNNPIRSVQVTGPTGPGNIILTVSSPINTFRWAVGDTFQIANLPSTSSLNTLNGLTFTATAVGQTTPTGTVTFSATTSIATATYTVTQGSVSNWDLSIDAHTSVFNRLKSSTANSSRTGTIQGAIRDAWKFRAGAIDDTGIDIAALRGAKAMSPANAVGAGIMKSSGTNNSGASSITVVKDTGADWSATTADYILIDQGDANGEADLQMYKVSAPTTVANGTTTSLPITPNLRTNITAGRLIVANWARTQVGDATGAKVVGVLELSDTASYPDGCLTVGTGIVTSTGTGCGGSASAAGAAQDIQFTTGSGVFAVDTGQFTYDSTNKILKVGTLTVQGKSTVPNQASFTNGAQACTLPGAGKSAWCFDTDGFFKVSEGNGAFFRPGNGAGSGNVVIQGTPSAGQSAEWSDGTHIAGIAVTGTGSYVKATSPTIATPKLDTINDVNGKLGLTFVATTNAVDGLCLTNAATANPATVTLGGCGTDTNISVNLISKGTGVILCNGVACGGGGSSSYTNLFQADANTLVQRNATVTQVYQLMGSYTDASNYQALELGGNYVKTTKLGTGSSSAFRFGVDSTGASFRGWQVLTSGLTLAPFNTSSAPDIGTAANRVGGLFATSADFTGAITVTVANEAATGTTLNKLAKLTGAPSTAIITGTSDVFGIAGIVTGGAGLSGSATLGQSGVASCVFDAGTTANHYVIPSATVAGDCHDSGVATSAAPPTGVQIIGAVQTTNVSAGTYSVLLGFEIGGGSGSGSGTVTTVSTSGGSPLFTSVVNNPTTAPQIVFTPSNAPANTLYANATGSSAPASFVQPLLTSSLFSSQGTNAQVLIGNASGNLSFGQVNASTMLTGNFVVAQFAGGVGATGSTVWCGNMTWCTPAGGGNVSVAGTTPVAGQSTEWAGATTIRAVANTGSGSVVRQTAPTLTNPLIPSIKDGSGNSAIDIIATLSAVNSFNVTNAATGGDVIASVQGADANISLLLSPKGTGRIKTTGPVQTSGPVGFHFGPEGIDPGQCAAGVDGFYDSSVNHYITMCNNGGVQQKIIGSSADLSISDFVVGAHFPHSNPGDLWYYNGSTWTNFPGNTSGTQFLTENSSGVPSWVTGTNNVAWSSIQNPAANYTPSMGAFTSSFTYTSAVVNAFAWLNSASATSGVSQSSPSIGIQGQYWTGAASAADIWAFQAVLANGANGASTLAITHAGSTGLALLSAPGFKTTGVSNQPALSSAEGTAPAGVAASDIFFADSTLHAWKMVNNNGTAIPVVGGPSGGSTSGDVAVFSGTAGAIVQDTNLVAANVPTAAAIFTNGDVIAAAGANRTLVTSGIQFSTLVTAAAVVPNGEVPKGDGARGLSGSGIAAANINFSTVNVTTDSIAVGSANSRQLKDSLILITNTFHTGTKTDVLNTATYCVDAGANDTYACNLSPAVTSYVSGKTRACFLANTINTGAASINFNGVGALPIKVPLRGSITANPLDGDIQAGSTVCGIYDGTNFVETSQPTVALSTFPGATLNGSLVYFNASNWVTFAGNASGTKFLQEDASGNLSWAAGSASVAVSSLLAAAGANSINNGDNAQRWNSSLTTSGNVFFRFSENVAATAAGTPWLFQVDSIAASTANIAKFTAVGTTNGVGVLKSGFLTSLGTGGTDSNMLFCDVTTATKCMQFTLSGISSATTRAVTIPDAASTTVVADTGASHQFLTAISAAGVISKAALVASDIPASLSSSTSINGLAITASTGTFAVTNAKTFSVLKTITLDGTDSTTMTFPSTSATIARTDAANTFTGNQTMTALLASASTAVTQTAKNNSTAIATTAYVDAATPLTSGTSVTLTAPRQYVVCTGTCTITVPVPAAGYEFCVLNTDNVATVITLSAIGSSARYENTARTAYGTAGTGTFVSGGAVGDKVCLLGLDSTHYLTASFNGTWTAN